ncbi:MAG: hypothetical protein HC929_09330 [Leptolyngbyaceae cyanobacterium SM2_5_2]|nr:hypothetical protein [Leptolyngbyaceae cyanobacterium SM2_5_2]
MDSELDELNPYEFCRGCRDTFPQIKVFLTRFHRGLVTDTERRWALQQGAAGFFNGFYRDTLMTTAAENIRCILQELEYHPFLDEQALLSVLLAIRRQLNPAQLAALAPSSRVSATDSPTINGRSPTKTLLPPIPQKQQTAPNILNDVTGFRLDYGL